MLQQWQDYLQSRKNELLYWFNNLPKSIQNRFTSSDAKYILLSRNFLIYNNIFWTIHQFQRLEFKHFSYQQWIILNRFRSGHNNLNANKKYDVSTIYCLQSNCVLKSIETTEHFLLKCPQYSNIRISFLYQLNNLYNKHYPSQQFMLLSIQEKLKFMFYPFEQILYQNQYNLDIKYFTEIWSDRIFCLKQFTQYIINTKRFTEFI